MTSEFVILMLNFVVLRLPLLTLMLLAYTGHTVNAQMLMNLIPTLMDSTQIVSLAITEISLWEIIT